MTTPSFAENTIAKFNPAQGTPDPFFGAHEKWHPLIDAMGFGAIRDLNMMRWIDVQPKPNVWIPPHKKELELINSFINRGGNTWSL